MTAISRSGFVAHRAGLTLTGLLLLAGCDSGGIKPNPTDPTFAGLGGPGDRSSISRLGGEDSGIIFGTSKERDKSAGGGAGVGMGVNAYLWRGALDTLSFMPLASADPFGGVIITDWYTPPSGNAERYKATAYILGRDLRSDGIKVNLYKQVLEGGHWVDAVVPEATRGEIEDRVLDKARKLREKAMASG